jgi:pyruvate ferredoxin oxidoreductase beta subunit
MDRQENIIYVCYDNEAYMNTGIQGSGSTTGGAWTTTTPGGKKGTPKNMMWFAKAHHIDYAATASIGYIDDFRKKIEKAGNIAGTAYLHVSAPCPTGWGYAFRDTVRVSKLAVDSGCWPLYELNHGRVKITRAFDKLSPVEEYLGLQKRFRNFSQEMLAALKKSIDENLHELKVLAELGEE